MQQNQIEAPLQLVLPPVYYDPHAPPDVVKIREYYEEIIKNLHANQTSIILYQEIYYERE